MKTKKLRILFIGNSHTYYNDMPWMVRERAVQDEYDCEVAMLAHGGWYLEQHAAEPDVRFNILYGHYDYVVLQEHTHPFAPKEKYFGAVRKLDAMIKKAGSRTVIFETWARKDEPEKQEEINSACRKIAEETGSLIASVGENWRAYEQSWQNLKMYAEDGAHPSREGSDFAAVYIWNAILTDDKRRR